MSRGKHLSLEEARRLNQLEQFCKEHESVGDESAFDQLLNAMAAGKSTGRDQERKEPVES